MKWILFFCLLLTQISIQAERNLTSPPPQLPVSVKTGFYLLNFTSLNEKDETFLADVYFSFRWNDPRLQFTSTEPEVYQEGSVKDKLKTIWRPQIEFINAYQPIYNNRTLFIYPNGDVEYHISITAYFYTPLNFKRFPFDQQKLTIRLDSFSWNKEILVFVPSTEKEFMLNKKSINSLEEHVLDVQEKEESIISGPITGQASKNNEFSSYVVTITIERKASFFLYQVYIPILLVIGMSCMVFFGHHEPFLDKIMINLTAFLVLLASKFTINLNLPEIGYLTIIDKSFLAAYICIGCTVIVDGLQQVWKVSHKKRTRLINTYARWSIYILFVLSLIIIYFSS